MTTEEKIKKIYSDLLRSYNANYLTLTSQIPFERNFSATQGTLYQTEWMLKTFEREFPDICHCDYDWHKGWKDENFEK